MLTLNCFFEITLVLRAEINPGKAALVIFFFVFIFNFADFFFYIFVCANFWFYYYYCYYFGKQILAFQIGLPVPCVHNGKPPVLQPFPQDKKQGQEEPLVSPQWSVPGADPRFNPPPRQGFQGAFFVSVVPLLCVWADATSARVPRPSTRSGLNGSETFQESCQTARKWLLGKFSYFLVGLKAREHCISVQGELPLLHPCTELISAVSFYPVLPTSL